METEKTVDNTKNICYNLKSRCSSAALYWDIAKSVRHRTLTPAFRRFESGCPSQKSENFVLGFFICAAGTTSFAWHTQHHLTVRSTSLPLAAQMTMLRRRLKWCCNKLQIMWCFASMMLRFAQTDMPAAWNRYAMKSRFAGLWEADFISSEAKRRRFHPSLRGFHRAISCGAAAHDFIKDTRLRLDYFTKVWYNKLTDK